MRGANITKACNNHSVFSHLFQNVTNSVALPLAENATPTPDDQMDFRVKTLKELKAEKSASAAQEKTGGRDVEGVGKTGLNHGREMGGLDKVKVQRSEVKSSRLRLQGDMPRRSKVKLGVQGSEITKPRLKISEGIIGGPEEKRLKLKGQKESEEKRVMGKESLEKKQQSIEMKKSVKMVGGLEEKKPWLSRQEERMEGSEVKKPDWKKLRLKEAQEITRESEEKKPQGKKLEAQEMSEEKKPEGKKLRLKGAQEKVRGSEERRLKLGGPKSVSRELKVETLRSKGPKVVKEVKGLEVKPGSGDGAELRETEKKKVTLVRRKVLQDSSTPANYKSEDANSYSVGSGTRPGAKRPRMEVDPLSVMKRQRFDESEDDDAKTTAGTTTFERSDDVKRNLGGTEQDGVVSGQDEADTVAMVGVAEEDGRKQRKMSIAELRKEM